MLVSNFFSAYLSSIISPHFGSCIVVSDALVIFLCYFWILITYIMSRFIVSPYLYYVLCEYWSMYLKLSTRSQQFVILHDALISTVMISKTHVLGDLVVYRIKVIIFVNVLF